MSAVCDLKAPYWVVGVHCLSREERFVLIPGLADGHLTELPQHRDKLRASSRDGNYVGALRALIGITGQSRKAVSAVLGRGLRGRLSKEEMCNPQAQPFGTSISSRLAS